MTKCLSLSVLFVALLSPALAQGQAICRVYEYAELRDYSQDKLLAMRCQYYSNFALLTDSALSNLRAHRTGAAMRDQSDGSRCTQEMKRMDNILQTKYGMTDLPKCFGN